MSIGDYGRSFARYQSFAKKVFFGYRLALPLLLDDPNT